MGWLLLHFVDRWLHQARDGCALLAPAALRRLWLHRLWAASSPGSRCFWQLCGFTERWAAVHFWLLLLFGDCGFLERWALGLFGSCCSLATPWVFNNFDYDVLLLVLFGDVVVFTECWAAKYFGSGCSSATLWSSPGKGQPALWLLAALWQLRGFTGWAAVLHAPAAPR